MFGNPRLLGAVALWAAAAQTAGGRHAITLGGEYARFQLNGVETSNQRGYYQFTNKFGSSAAENFRCGSLSI